MVVVSFSVFFVDRAGEKGSEAIAADAAEMGGLWL
jgi:hypothetical protein